MTWYVQKLCHRCDKRLCVTSFVLRVRCSVGTGVVFLDFWHMCCMVEIKVVNLRCYDSTSVLNHEKGEF